ncbi:CDP-glycerol glycerophosphotransferase family protein [Microbacterium awajiense]|uniref:CDP-glycerol glycerophosphotransferase family protein n=1 Tax=Microbacterium awajiense TaxID=415214 RepID=A0ABP7A9Y6_9MICO
MASFSFDAGNAAKLAALPLYAIGRLVTLLVPRGDEWVFGSAAGIGDGALALWPVAVADGRRCVWLIGSAREAAEAAARGIPTLPRRSLRGFWRTARAAVVVVTHGFGDVNRFAVSGAFVVQLWHGIPLKRIGLDSPVTSQPPALLGRGVLARAASQLVRLLYRAAARRIRVLPAASDLVRGRLESAFALPDDRVPVTGEPRVDVLSRGRPADRRSIARAAIAQAAGSFDARTRVVLYAPTWRDGQPDPAIPDADEWDAIADVLRRHDAVLLVRSHPLGSGAYAPPAPTERVRMLGSEVVTDVTPLLSGVDVLVTDYSSLVFDSALVPVPVVFLAPDVARYARTRGFYGTYPEVAGDGWATTWAEAATQLDAVLGDDAEASRRRARAEALSERVHAHRDGGNSIRVYRAILAGLRTGAAGRGRR